MISVHCNVRGVDVSSPRLSVVGQMHGGIKGFAGIAATWEGHVRKADDGGRRSSAIGLLIDDLVIAIEMELVACLRAGIRYVARGEGNLKEQLPAS